MKRYCLLLSLIMLHLMGFAQHKSKAIAVVAATKMNVVYKSIPNPIAIAVVAATKMNVVYKSIPNPIAIAVSGYKAEDLVVKVSVGTIFKEQENQYMFFSSAKDTNEVTFTVFVKLKNKKLKLISSSLFRLKEIPKPNICFGSNCANSLLFYNNLQK